MHQNNLDPYLPINVPEGVKAFELMLREGTPEQLAEKIKQVTKAFYVYITMPTLDTLGTVEIVTRQGSVNAVEGNMLIVHDEGYITVLHRDSFSRMYHAQ